MGEQRKCSACSAFSDFNVSSTHVPSVSHLSCHPYSCTIINRCTVPYQRWHFESISVECGKAPGFKCLLFLFFHFFFCSTCLLLMVHFSHVFLPAASSVLRLQFLGSCQQCFGARTDGSTVLSAVLSISHLNTLPQEGNRSPAKFRREREEQER